MLKGINTEIGLFCTAYKDWTERLAGEPYFLKIKEDNGYVIFNYDQIKSDFNNPIVREARGIIFKKGVWDTPVCWAFNKFGNYGESYVPDIDWSTAFVTEKIDGSLIKVWWDWDNGWHVSTNGTIDAFKAELGDINMPNFGEYFMKVVNKYYGSFENFVEDLDVDLTYMFELVGPYNRVVIPYEKSDVYFLGARDKYTSEEFFCTEHEKERLGVSRFKCPTIYPLTSLKDCLEVTEKFSWDQEGFVVADSEFNRVKIKSPAYVLAHFMRNNNVINRKHLIRIILTNETEEFLCYASEYKEALLETQRLMNVYYKVGNKLAETCRVLVGQVPRSLYAKTVKTLPIIFHGLLFYNHDRAITAEEYSAGWNENKWEVYLEAIEELGQEYLSLTEGE